MDTPTTFQQELQQAQRPTFAELDTTKPTKQYASFAEEVADTNMQQAIADKKAKDNADMADAIADRVADRSRPDYFTEQEYNEYCLAPSFFRGNKEKMYAMMERQRHEQSDKNEAAQEQRNKKHHEYMERSKADVREYWKQKAQEKEARETQYNEYVEQVKTHNAFVRARKTPPPITAKPYNDAKADAIQASKDKINAEREAYALKHGTKYDPIK